jgi:cyclic pyranopterin phosphate synthase
MLDQYGRDMKSMRISVTQMCNFGCFYCHREGQSAGNEELSPDEIERIVEVAASLGMRKVKITGGEPLLRKDIVEIVGRIANHVDEVSMTTNGILLEHLASKLVESGLKRVNVSLDSLDPSTFKAVTGTDLLKDVKEGIVAAVHSGLKVKLNVVMLNGINTMELDEMMKFSSSNNAILQLIELTTERCSVNTEFYKMHHYDLAKVEREFQDSAVEIKFNELHNRRKYFVPLNGSSGASYQGKVCEVELVRSMHNSDFCSNCTRLRLTSDGKLKPCLLTNEGLVDVLGAVRNGGGTDDLKDRFKAAIYNRRPYWREEDRIESETEVLCPL